MKMHHYRALIIYPVPADLGMQAAQLPGAQYFLKSQVLIVPTAYVLAVREIRSPATLHDADWALYAIWTEYFGQPLNTIPLTISVANEAAMPALPTCSLRLPTDSNRTSTGHSPRPFLHRVKAYLTEFQTWIVSRFTKRLNRLVDAAPTVTGKTTTNIYP